MDAAGGDPGGMKLSIVVPAYNEEGRIGQMLETYLPYFAERYGNDFEIVVAVNGSTDRTEAIVRAIIHAESAFNPAALSHAGAQGLMQLMPATARRFGVTDSYDATQNIRGGVQYLAWLLKRFNGDLKLAAAGYNAGEGAVDKYKGVPPYSETRRYVDRVATLAERYRGSLAQR